MICIYDTLKSSPGIIAVAVYALDEGGVAIRYQYSDRKGAVTSSDLYVGAPNGTGRFQYVGDFMNPDNPVSKLTGELASKCQADGGYIDQVILTPASRRVDMSKRVALPN